MTDEARQVIDRMASRSSFKIDLACVNNEWMARVVMDYMHDEFEPLLAAKDESLPRALELLGAQIEARIWDRMKPVGREWPNEC